MLLRSHLLVVSVVAVSSWTITAAAQDAPVDGPRELKLAPLPSDGVEKAPPPPREVRDGAPRLGLTEGPFGLAGGTMWAAAVGGGTSAGKGQSYGEGGVLVGGAPIDRLTLHVFGGRTSDGRWAPDATAHVTFLGSTRDGYALGALARYKLEGFSEAGGEVELGLTGGLRTRRFYLDVNAIFGAGLEEEEGGEMDGELKLRTGIAATDALRVGIDGRARKRMNGSRTLAGNKTWDALGGPQISLALGSLYCAVQGGATTVSIADGVGVFGLATVGATVP